MLAIFCLRLTFGLLACLPLLWSFPINPRFFRIHFLNALGLLSGATVLLRAENDFLDWAVLSAGMITCLLGSIVWTLDKAPGGGLVIVLSSLLSGCALTLNSMEAFPTLETVPLADNFSSAAFLGSATTAMLLGHSYLIAPTLSITPLLRILGFFGVSLLIRVCVSVYGLWSWTESSLFGNLDTETLIWLTARLGVGFLIPAILGWMAYETARIRSTQSATGILYVVVICVFLGELTAMLLFQKTGFTL